MPLASERLFKWKGGAGLCSADVNKCFTLEDLADHVQRKHMPPHYTTVRPSGNEALAGWVLDVLLCEHEVQVDIDKEVRGLSLMPALYDSPRKRADITIYNKDRLQLLLQVEVQSSPMEQAVSKAIRGAADILRLGRCHKLDLRSLLCLPFQSAQKKKCSENNC